MCKPALENTVLEEVNGLGYSTCVLHASMKASMQIVADMPDWTYKLANYARCKQFPKLDDLKSNLHICIRSHYYSAKGKKGRNLPKHQTNKK